MAYATQQERQEARRITQTNHNRRSQAAALACIKEQTKANLDYYRKLEIKELQDKLFENIKQLHIMEESGLDVYYKNREVNELRNRYARFLLY